MSDDHVYPLHVRWSDVDAYGHVNNVKYFEYFQESRISFLSRLVRVAGGRSLVVARVTVDYKRPMFFRQTPYEVRTRVLRLGGRSFHITSRIHDQLADDSPVLASATAVLVAFDAATQSSRELDTAERDYLEGLLTPSTDTPL
ncbi:MAG: thioesterase family protein [Nocardioidaceae bacterium]|nr:thioesterase family protein [Nocardioidaceae bacterium]